MACEPKQSGYSRARQRVAERIFTVYYKHGSIFVPLATSYEIIVLRKVTAIKFTDMPRQLFHTKY